MTVPNESRCEIMLGREMMEEVDELKNLGQYCVSMGVWKGKQEREREQLKADRS